MSMLIQDIDLDGPVLLVLKHTVMFAAMLVAMLVRHDEYAGRDDHASASRPIGAADHMHSDGRRACRLTAAPRAAFFGLAR